MLTRRAMLGAVGACVLAPRAWASENAALLGRAKAALDRNKRRVTLRDRVMLADFAQHSSLPRFHLVDLVQGWTRSYLVAHGKGSDPEHSGYLQRFSNEVGSLATSSGAYVTGAIYEGQHGSAMRLQGLDATNSNAEDRAIVIHTARYVGQRQIEAFGKLGRSDGCFVVAPDVLPVVLGLLGPWRLLYADGATADLSRPS